MSDDQEYPFKKLTAIDRAIILGGSGSGKSSTAYTIIKNIRDKKHQMIILDFSNDYDDLPKEMFKRYKANKINPMLLPARLRRNKRSALIKFTKMKDLDDRRKFFIKFMESCFDKNWNDTCMIVVDEAHNFIPQISERDKILKKSKFWGNNLLSDGRKHGLGSLIVTQRTAKIDKNSLAECEKIFVHRHILKSDITTLKGVLGKFGFDVEEEVPKLEIGEIFECDFHKFKYEKYMMPEPKDKKLGTTPKPRGVEPKKDSWLDWFKDTEVGLSDTEVNVAAATIILLIIILSIAGISLYYRDKTDTNKN